MSDNVIDFVERRKQRNRLDSAYSKLTERLEQARREHNKAITDQVRRFHSIPDDELWFPNDE